jgi:hypothetical protein
VQIRAIVGRLPRPDYCVGRIGLPFSICSVTALFDAVVVDGVGVEGLPDVGSRGVAIR